MRWSSEWQIRDRHPLGDAALGDYALDDAPVFNARRSCSRQGWSCVDLSMPVVLFWFLCLMLTKWTVFPSHCSGINETSKQILTIGFRGELVPRGGKCQESPDRFSALSDHKSDYSSHLWSDIFKCTMAVRQQWPRIQSAVQTEDT